MVRRRWTIGWCGGWAARLGFAAAAGCASTPLGLGLSVGPADAERWSHHHDTTIAQLDQRVAAFLASLPSLPGDRFFCRETLTPPATPAANEAALRDMLCRQQLGAWNAERFEAEEDLGPQLLNGAFLAFGVAGIDLSLAGPDGVEWADHRGIWAFPTLPDRPAPVPATEGIALGAAKLGWGLVDVGGGGTEPDLRWALERSATSRRREATATVRVFLLVEGTPDAAFVRAAVAGEPAPAAPAP